MATRSTSITPASYAAVLALPFGAFGLSFEGRLIREMVFLPPETPALAPTTPWAIDAAERIEQWLAAPEQALELPLSSRGTPFQRRVWDAINRIPCGSVVTYGALAARLGSAPRAVGQACGANPFPLATPCHRVVSASGIGGFANATDGFLLTAKRWLLAHEGAW